MYFTPEQFNAQPEMSKIQAVLTQSISLIIPHIQAGLCNILLMPVFIFLAVILIFHACPYIDYLRIGGNPNLSFPFIICVFISPASGRWK